MPDRNNAGLGIAVVGIGAIFPRAGDAASFWRNIEGGVDAIGDVPPGRWDPGMYYDAGAYDKPVEVDRFYCRRGGFVDDLADFDPVAFGVMPSAVAGTEPDQLLALRATAEAIADAGGDGALGDRSRTGVILGRGGYLGPATARLDQQVRTAAQLMVTLRELLPDIGQDRLDGVRASFQAKLSETAAGRAAPDSAIGLVPNIAASRIANRLDLQGPAYTVDAACASGLIAVELAVSELASGRCDAVLAGAVHHCHVATIWSVFTQLRALSRGQQIRPFDRHADGTLISEGTGMVLLKRLADAEAAGDRIYAVIRGVGTASDGRSSSLMSPSPDGQVLALARAWASAGLDPSLAGAVGLLEAHGTGTPAGDESELIAIARVFGPPKGSGEAPVLGTVKSMIGHAMPAAGIAGLIKAVLAVHHGVLPPTLHAEDPRAGVAATRFRLIDRSEPWPEGAVRRAGVNAFGFGGINAHVIVEQAPGAPAAHAPVVVVDEPEPAERTVLLAAGSKQELLAALESGATTGGDGRYRLAIVDPTEHRLGLARKVVERGTPWRGRNDVWFTPRPLLGEAPGAGGQATGRIAFLFPGFEPELVGPVDSVADHFGLERPLLARTGTLVDQSVDIGVVGRLYVEALRRLRIVPDVLAGHSLGEWTAMIVGGMLEPRTVADLTRLFRERRSELPDAAYAALGCGADQAVAALRDLDAVVLSHDNCPHQCVVCGLPDRVEAALGTLRERGVLGQVMPFRSGFHSPMMRSFVGGAREVFDSLGVRPAAVPVWSATSVAPYPDEPEAVRDLVVRHLLEPVHFRRMIEALHDAGVRAFVQVGSGSLTGFVEDTLAKRDHLAIAAQTAQRGGLSQLRRVAAALWAEGASPAVDRLPGSAAPPQAPAHPRMRLDLGTPLVHLGDAVAGLGPSTPTTTTPGPLAPAADPVFAAFEAALAEAEASARVIASAWSAATPPAPRGTGSVPAAPGMPATEVESQPPGILRIERSFSLETMPEMADHCLVPQPPGWPDTTDRFPVVPIATLLEVMGEAATTRFPGRVVLGFRRIRALRWLTVAPPTTSILEVHDEVEGHVRVVIPGYADGLVHLGTIYPPAPEPAGWPLAGSRAPDVDAPSLYADRWMFHGPAFAGVTEITAVGDDGMRGKVEALPARGALLDAAGQLAGHWCHVSAPRDRTVFPTSIANIALFGPAPQPGDRLRCDVRVRELSADTLEVDMELRSAAGSVWARVDAWTYRRFATDDVVWNALKMQPSTTTLGEPQDGGWCLVRQRWHDRASQELTMRNYLVAAERVDYERRKPRAQPTWLLGRIAAKDAVRHRLWDQGHGALFPAEIRVGNDAEGRPWIRSPGPEALTVSLAHTDGLGVAIVRPAAGGRVGIDVEAIARVGAASDAIGAIALTIAEQELLDRLTLSSLEERSVWMTRFWTAKEAAAKAEGTGLAGRPHDYEVVEADGEHLTVTVRGRSPYHVSTRLVHAGTEASPPPQASHVVAWTVDRPSGRNP